MDHILTHRVAQTWTCTCLSLGLARGSKNWSHMWLLFRLAHSSHFDSPRGSNMDIHLAHTWTRTWISLGLTRGSNFYLCTCKLLLLVLKDGSHIDSHVVHTWTRMWRLAPGVNLDSPVAHNWTCTSTKVPASCHLCFFLLCLRDCLSWSVTTCKGLPCFIPFRADKKNHLKLCYISSKNQRTLLNINQLNSEHFVPVCSLLLDIYLKSCTKHHATR